MTATKSINANYPSQVKAPENTANSNTKSPITITNASPKERGSKEIESSHGSSFTHCNSLSAYPTTCSSTVNKSLNLHLGMPIDPRSIHTIRKICVLLSDFLSFIELHLFKIWDNIPLRLRQYVTMKVWSVYLPLHKATLSNRTGIHVNASYEYHALSTIMYWSRLFPMSIRRMRFSLSQLVVWHGHDVYPFHDRVGMVDTVYYNQFDTTTIDQEKKDGLSSSSLMDVLSIRESNRPVSGYYIHHHQQQQQQQQQQQPNASKKVLFYLYGGAFLSGTAESNKLYGMKISQKCKMDVFLPSYRLLPEYHFLDALEDVIRAYCYLITVRGVKAENVILFGISSGGGLIVRLLQRIVEMMNVRDTDTDTDDSSSSLELQGAEFVLEKPCGAVLMSPFVDYTEPKGSFKDYTVHDLIVNESVFEEGIPYFSTLGNDETRYAESPINRPLKGLPPICLIVSEHECCYDQNIVLCNRAREAGVSVDLGVWKYMCHVWPVLSAFLPEARSAVDFVCDWIVERKE